MLFCGSRYVPRELSALEGASYRRIGRANLFLYLRRSKKSSRPTAWLYCRFLIFTQVVASGVYLAFACLATIPSMSRSQSDAIAVDSGSCWRTLGGFRAVGLPS